MKHKRDLQKLTADCAAAKQAGIYAAAGEDGGSANLDCTFLLLERGERSEPVVRAIQAAGLSCNAQRWIGRGVMISPPACGQGNSRYRANNTVLRTLSGLGWRVVGYYQMD